MKKLSGVMKASFTMILEVVKSTYIICKYIILKKYIYHM